MYRWTEDLEAPEHRELRWEIERDPALSPGAKKRILEDLGLEQRDLSYEERDGVARDVARQIGRQRTREFVGEKSRPMDAISFPKNGEGSVRLFQRTRDQADELQERAELARTAAGQAFAKAAGIAIGDSVFVRAIFAEILSAAAEEYADATIDRVPTDLVLAKSFDVANRLNSIVDKQTWRALVGRVLASPSTDRRPTEAIRMDVESRIRATARRESEFGIQEREMRRTVEEGVRR